MKKQWYYGNHNTTDFRTIIIAVGKSNDVNKLNSLQVIYNKTLTKNIFN